MINGRTVPVIVYTAHPNEDLGDKMRDVGVNEVISKTISPTEMMAHVMQFLKK